MAITLSGTAITMNDSSTIVSTTTIDAIGSYSVLAPLSTVSRGSTIAGSSLRHTTHAAYYSGTGLAGTSLSGTWRNMSNQTVPARGPVGSEGAYQSTFNVLFCRSA